jgi:hypothetical protein
MEPPAIASEVRTASTSNLDDALAERYWTLVLLIRPLPSSGVALATDRARSLPCSAAALPVAHTARRLEQRGDQQTGAAPGIRPAGSNRSLAYGAGVDVSSPYATLISDTFLSRCWTNVQ